MNIRLVSVLFTLTLLLFHASISSAQTFSALDRYGMGEAPPMGTRKFSDNGSAALSGLLLMNLGEEASAQPNVMVSGAYSINSRNALEMRLLGLQKNKDTVQFVNGLNLIKPELSQFDFRLTGDFHPLKKAKEFAINSELNIYGQNMAKKEVTSNAVTEDMVTSLLFRLSLAYTPVKGVTFFASGVNYQALSGVEFYEERFGVNAPKSYLNFEMSGKFQVQSESALAGAFVQASLNLNSSSYKELLNSKDVAVFLIRIGFDKAIAGK